MSTPDEPSQLTRRQLREIRNTAATPIITDPSSPVEPPAEQPVPLPRAAEPVELPAAPVESEVDVDSAAPALTRREARQRERLRTASVPVITPDVAASYAATTATTEEEAQPAPSTDSEVVADPSSTTPPDADDASAAPVDAVATASPEPWAPPAAAFPSPVIADTSPATDAPTSDSPANDVPVAPDDSTADEVVVPAPTADDEPDARRVIDTNLGADVWNAAAATDVEVPASFDQLITRATPTGAGVTASNALILEDTPEAGTFVSPVTATGELLVTGTFALPDSYGSTGTVPGKADGHEADAVLVDGELPAASSPTPIAASAAISTIKSADEIIKPPAPEKGGRLMLILTIAVGVLAVGVVGTLVYAMMSGAFS